jgi:hypothetical protein
MSSQKNGLESVRERGREREGVEWQMDWHTTGAERCGVGLSGWRGDRHEDDVETRGWRV